MGSRQNYNNFAEMLSTPVDFLMSNFEIIFSTSFLLTSLNEKTGVSSGRVSRSNDKVLIISV